MYNPFAFYRVTQSYSKAHQAIDYGMDPGTVLPACSSGRVVYEYFTDAGYTATIHRLDGSWTRYCHGEYHGFPRAHDTDERTPVKMLSGDSGTGTGPHLHAYDTDSAGNRQPPFTTGTTPAAIDVTPITEPGIEEDMATDLRLVERTTHDGDPNLNGMTCLMGPKFFTHFGNRSDFDEFAKLYNLTPIKVDARQFVLFLEVLHIPLAEAKPNSRWDGRNS